MEKDKKELNLVDVFSSIWKWCVNFFRWGISVFVRFLRLLFRHRVLTLFCLLFSLAGGIALYIFDTPFRSGFVVSTHGQIYYGMEVVNDMNRYCRKGTLGTFLGIDDSVAMQVKAVKSYYVVDRWLDGIVDFVDYDAHYGKDTLLNTWSKNLFYVEVISSSEDIVPAVKDAIILKLCEHPIIHSTWETSVNSQLQWLESHIYDLARLDSVQNKLYSAVNTHQNVSGRIESDRLEYISENRVQIFTYERQNLLNSVAYSQRYLDELNLGPVYVPVPIQYDGKKTSLPKTIVLFGMLGLFAVLLISLFIERKEDISSFLRG